MLILTKELCEQLSVNEAVVNNQYFGQISPPQTERAARSGNPAPPVGVTL